MGGTDQRSVTELSGCRSGVDGQMAMACPVAIIIIMCDYYYYHVMCDGSKRAWDDRLTGSEPLVAPAQSKKLDPTESFRWFLEWLPEKQRTWCTLLKCCCGAAAC
jgi:hypothetical protein